MNSCNFIGRLTATPELRYTGSADAKAVCNFCLAVERMFRDSEGNAVVDFIDFVAFGKQAEFVCKWFDKGVRIGVHGKLQTSVYEKDGQKHKSVQIVVDSAEFADGKREANANTSATNTSAVNTGDDFLPLDDLDDDLPFNGGIENET